ncbi:MAG: type II toxin-antitoxin system RelE/ParE family toxin [Calditrichaceae bacterium]|nr:type II toxin-antitoxin system RelE/ParE family toxin [Calditrichaceae bacterium]MBN2709814.1 type II toxin-antitoxin system RelE/ParE family toxin [Calditrichaceae bacterium]
MIKTFKCKETERIYNREISKKLPLDIQRTALKKLWMLDASPDINTLRVPPSNHLEALKGERKGQHSIRINKQWRICFVWNNSDAFDVEIVDYH